MRQLQALIAEVGDDDVPRALELGDEARHDADRPGTGDEHVLGQRGKLQRRVDGIAEGIEDRRHIGVQSCRVHPHIGGGHREVFAERAIDGVSDALGIAAEVTFAGQAGPAAAAHVVSLAGDELAHLETGHRRPKLDDGAAELVSDHARGAHDALRPSVPRRDMDVGAADPGATHLDQHLIRTGGRDR